MTLKQMEGYFAASLHESVQRKTQYEMGLKDCIIYPRFNKHGYLDIAIIGEYKGQCIGCAIDCPKKKLSPLAIYKFIKAVRKIAEEF